MKSGFYMELWDLDLTDYASFTISFSLYFGRFKPENNSS